MQQILLRPWLAVSTSNDNLHHMYLSLSLTEGADVSCKAHAVAVISCALSAYPARGVKGVPTFPSSSISALGSFRARRAATAASRHTSKMQPSASST